jgi:hypothetical protein
VRIDFGKVLELCRESSGATLVGNSRIRKKSRTISVKRTKEIVSPDWIAKFSWISPTPPPGLSA